MLKINPKLRFIDSHAHLSDPQLIPHADEMIQRARLQRIVKIVNICTDEQSLAEGLALAQRYPEIYNTAATTPHDVEEQGAHFFPLVEKTAREGKLIALGETGLDYFYTHSPRKSQEASLIAYCALSARVNLPLIFHCRNAFDELFAITDAHYSHRPAILHCFTGSLQDAKKCIDRGWYISISGIVTFKKSEELRAVVKYVPLDHLLLETDAPYLAPQSRRGKVNEPSFLVETAELVASLKEVSLETLGEITTGNAERFFSF